jgi:N-acetylated-alpha-linked acidic dipeptidase
VRFLSYAPAGRCCLCLFAHLPLTPSTPGITLRGYTPEDSATEIGWEQKFRELPDRDHIRENMRRLSARPHHVGSPYDKDNAEWLLAQLKSYGLDAQIETFSALCSRRRSRASWSCWARRLSPRSCRSLPISVDPTSSQTSEQLPTYNAYSRDGDVTAPLVYVNYGRPEDYDESWTVWAFR